MEFLQVLRDLPAAFRLPLLHTLANLDVEWHKILRDEGDPRWQHSRDPGRRLLRHQVAYKIFVHALFAEGAHQHCEAVRLGKLSAERLDPCVQAFVESLASYLYYRPDFGFHGERDDFRDALRENVEKSPTWFTYLQERAAVMAPASEAVAGSMRQKPSARLIKWRKSVLKEYRNRTGLQAAALAHELGSNTRAIQAVAAEDWKRFDGALQKKLLERIGVTVDQWYQESGKGSE